MKRELQIKTLDLAKRLLDFGFHPPTVYFPLLVEEALMVEPTETETKETLDAFADAIAAILREAAEDPEIARERALHDARAAPGRGRARPSARSSARRLGAAERTMRIFSGIQPTGRKHLGNYIGAITQYVAGAGARRGASSASSTCTRSPSPTTRPSCASACTTLTAILLAAGLDPRALHPVPPERRARAHRADLAAVERHRATASCSGCTSSATRPARAARARLRRAALLPGAAGRRRARLPRRRRCRSARTSASTSS